MNHSPVAGLILITLALGLAGCAAQPRPTPSAAAPFASGDRLRIAVFNEPSLSGEQTIDACGNILMPLVGLVPARGLEAAGLEGELAKRLASGFETPKVQVELAHKRQPGEMMSQACRAAPG